MTLKSTRYRKVEPAALNRRSVSRHQVKLTSASLKRSNDLPLQASLEDISIYGCRLAADAVFQEGEMLTIVLPEQDPINARVIWQKANQIGCRFEVDLHPRRLTDLIQNT